MIYIDQPSGTGFSWGEPLVTDMNEAKNDFIRFCVHLFNMYPEFKGRSLYLTGESYGGKYLPAYAVAMYEYNAVVANNFFNLKATLCGDPYTAPMTQRTHMHVVPYALNIIDQSNMPQIAALERRCEESVWDDSLTDE